MNQFSLNKLLLQVESFEEGFITLSKSSSITGIISGFSQILRDNFIAKDVYVFQKDSGESGWINIQNENIDGNDLIKYLSANGSTRIYNYPDEKIAASVTMPMPDYSRIGIIIKSSNGDSSFTDVDKIVLRILLQVFDAAYKSFLDRKKEKKLIFDLNEKVVQLNNLVDTAIELSRFGKRNILYNLALERIASVTNAASAMIKISSGSNGIEEYFTFPENIDHHYILNSKFKIESSFVYKDKDYSFILSEKETREGSSGFNELDQVLLDAITRQVAAAIENEDLHNKALEKEIIEKEIAVAASIQKQIIPEVLPVINGYEIAGLNIPSKEVGGDYFDCITLSNGKYAFIIADVAGKGISAALLVSTLNAALYSYLEFNLPLEELSSKLNKLIYKSSPPDKYITFFIAVLDPAAGNLDIVNAGHNPIMLLRKTGELEKIDAGGIGLGMLDFGLPYSGKNTVMNEGDILFLYTDGIPEAMNIMEEEYSDEKMINFLKKNSDLTAGNFIDALVADVKSFTGNAPQSDDITALVIKRI